MQRDYLSDPMYTFESANHASKACGPLVQWAVAQVSDSEIILCRVSFCKIQLVL